MKKPVPTFDESRRKMLKQTALASGSFLLPASTPLLRSTHSDKKKLGIALVGLGNYSNRQLAPALQLTEHCYLAAIVTGTPEKEVTWAEKYNIPKKNIYNYQNFDQIKHNPDIDIVYVVLPNSMHEEFTIRAAQAGKHVICEKPLSTSVERAKRMIAACKKANVKLQVGYRLYFEPHHLYARKLGNEATYGKVRLLESSLGFSMANPTSWRLNKELGGGGAIVDLGVYAIQGARRVIGELPETVTAQGFNTRPEIFKGIYEGLTWQMRFPGKAISNHSTTYSTYIDRMYATTGPGRSWFEIRPSFSAVGTKGATKEGVMDFEIKDYQQIDQMDEFAMAIKENRPTLAPGEEGLIDLQIIEAILESAKNGGRETAIKW